MNTTTRKRPQCHTCGNLMAGHKRQNGSPVCPPISPPSSRGSSPTPTVTENPDWAPARARRNSFTPSETPSLVRALESLPGGEVVRLPGGWRLRRNPHWEEPSSPTTRLEDTWSVADTEPLERLDFGDRGNDDSGNDDRGNDFFDYDVVSESLVASSNAVAAIYNAPTSDRDRIRNLAAKHGIFHGIVHRVSGAFGSSSNDSEWVVLGRDARAVNHVLSTHEQGFGGGMGLEMLYPKTMSNMQLVAVVALGVVLGCLAIRGLGTNYWMR